MTLKELVELAKAKGVPDDAQIAYIDIDYPSCTCPEEIRIELETVNQGLPSEHVHVAIWS